MTQLVRKGERVKKYWKKDVYERYLRGSKSRKFELSSKERNRDVHVGCIVFYYNNSRRGLTRVACPKREAMREPGTWDKREVVTPTSFIYNLKLIAETWESNRQLSFQLSD